MPHTSGEWFAEENGFGYVIKAKRPSGKIDTISDVVSALQYQDALLIAAAPDLKNALVALLAIAAMPRQGDYFLGIHIPSALASAVAAIAKAEGRQ